MKRQNQTPSLPSLVTQLFVNGEIKILRKEKCDKKRKKRTQGSEMTEIKADGY